MKAVHGGAGSVRILLERVPIKWNHLIDKDAAQIQRVEHVGIEKVELFFRELL